MSGHRAERVADQVREILSRLLREELRDPRVGFVTVTDVALSPDLKNARVFVSFLHGDRETALATLNRAAGFLRRALAREAGLRFTPLLKFEEDTSIDRGFRVDELLREAHREPDEDPEPRS